MDNLVGILNFFKHLKNPVTYSKIDALKKNHMLIRSDGRSPSRLQQENGFLPRVGIDQLLLQSAAADLVKNQKYNSRPFTYGACNSISSLDDFIKANSGHVRENWIYLAFGLAVSLGALKREVGNEPGHLDFSHELLIVERVTFKNILAAISPEQVSKFLNGQLVPNTMYELNKKLPQKVQFDNLLSEENVLQWLLSNNSDGVFEQQCENLGFTAKLAGPIYGNEAP